MTLRRYLLPAVVSGYLSTLTLGLCLVTVFLRVKVTNDLQQALETYALLLEGLVHNVTPLSLEGLSVAARIVSDEGTGPRLSILDQSGNVIWDSIPEALESWQVPLPEEVRLAAAGQRVTVGSYDPFLGGDALVVLRPVLVNSQVIAVVRCAALVPTTIDMLRPLTSTFAALFLLAILAATATYLALTVKLEAPITELRHGLHQRGIVTADWDSRSDYRQAISAIRTIIADLQEQLHAAANQRNELESVLSGLVEAVFVVDNEATLVRYNEAAAKLFGLPKEAPNGRSVQEIIRNAEFLRFVRQTLAADQAHEGELTVRVQQPQVLRAYGVGLFDEQAGKVGCLIVLHDISRERQLELAGKEFIANVSHELKTPITAIKGFVETLLDGALEEPDSATRFLRIIHTQSEHLQRLVEDLLTLSRLERQSRQTKLELTEQKILDLVQASAAVCSVKAAAKNLILTFDCPSELTAWLKPDLIQQALVNLIDNAIKYSAPHTTVSIRCRQQDSTLTIKVADTGCGIAPEHQQRVFERFFRVKAALGEEQEGSGLGLPIVKHIVNAHSGGVSVESSPGNGSIFTITLPYQNPI